MRESYRGFALAYDEMMAERNYREWAEYVLQLAGKYGVSQPSEILDLACGTGSFLQELRSCGASLYGADLSVEMLAVAAQKLDGAAVLLQQDMRSLKLDFEFSLITCMCDSLNYLMSSEEIASAFRSIKRHLLPDGIFVADLNSKYKYQNLLGNDSFAEVFENSAYIWENSYDESTDICEMNIDFFVRERGELYRHLIECHHQKSYSLNELARLAAESGFSTIEFWSAFTGEKINPNAEEEYFETVGATAVKDYKFGRFFMVLK